MQQHRRTPEIASILMILLQMDPAAVVVLPMHDLAGSKNKAAPAAL
ncbi:hypothetical protein [uncultured Enterobacter sp.]|nr:hypothetical protein [uncultured Enterobacter sp.]